MTQLLNTMVYKRRDASTLGVTIQPLGERFIGTFAGRRFYFSVDRAEGGILLGKFIGLVIQSD